MVKMEHKVRAEIRKTRINAAIIGTLAIVGALTVAAVAPNVFKALDVLKNPHQRRQTVNKSLERLIERGYVEKNGDTLQLSARGEYFAAQIGEGRLAPTKPKRWDGKWRLLIFDIPEYRKRTRNQVRTTLQGLGFHRLQDSVWVYPYDCEDFVILLKTDLRIGKDLLYIIADQIENDRAVLNHFGLRQR